MEIGFAITTLRKLKKITQKDLAKKIGITPKHLNEIEKSKAFPNWKMLNKITNSLGANISITTNEINFKF